MLSTSRGRQLHTNITRHTSTIKKSPSCTTLTSNRSFTIRLGLSITPSSSMRLLIHLINIRRPSTYTQLSTLRQRLHTHNTRNTTHGCFSKSLSTQDRSRHILIRLIRLSCYRNDRVHTTNYFFSFFRLYYAFNLLVHLCSIETGVEEASIKYGAMHTHVLLALEGLVLNIEQGKA